MIKLFENQEFYLTNEIIQLFEDTLNQENLYDARLFFNKNIMEKKSALFEDAYLKAECFSVLTQEDFNPVNSYFQESLTNGFVIEYFSKNFTEIKKLEFNYDLWWKRYGFDPVEEFTKDNIFYIKKFLKFSFPDIDYKLENQTETYNWNTFVSQYSNIALYRYAKTDSETKLVEKHRKKLKEQNSVDLKDVLYCTTMVRSQQKEINKGFINSGLVLNNKHNREKNRNKTRTGRFVTDNELHSRYTNRVQTQNTRVERIYYEFWSFIADLFENFYKEKYEQFDDVYYLGELEDVKEVYREQGFYDFIENEN